ncbi:IS4 family transposase [Tahibacter soli]|uniref:IS4 family transposase n=1 Tax=Tahibacter soli TaxID=2983605 RepID=A0A9X4BK14_9GAMM|nr:IS4 family transposase [Tahibacter soli]MDC8013752.1 IS4 family transposase [Tahibacter soli]
MYRVSRLGELLEESFRARFDAQVRQHNADKHLKKFKRWDQFVAMTCAQLQGATSLRALTGGLKALSNHHYHLRTRLVGHSTLADANQRDPAVFGAVAQMLMSQVARKLRKECQRTLVRIDSTSITLKGNGFDAWTSDTSNCFTQGLKLHVALDDADVPVYHSITAANVNDVTEGAKIPIERGTTYVFDKGYCDYGWWWSIHQAGAWFVTRVKTNAALKVEQTLPIPPGNRSRILADEVVRLSNKNPGAGRKNPYTARLRRITIRRDNDQTLVLISNDLDRSAAQIAACYQQRWDVELFFKWLKQHLNIKRYLGRSPNAVRTQLLIALIVYLLVALLRHRTKTDATLWLFTAVLRMTLFERPQLHEDMRQRRATKAAELDARQPQLADWK